MSELALTPQSGLLSYIVGSLTAPRMKVRQLMVESELKSVGWKLVLIAASVSALAGILSGLYEYSYRPGGFETAFLPAEYALTDIFLWGAVEFGLLVGSFLLSIFLWSYLFGYRDQANAVWAAAVMSCCLAAIMDPLAEIVTLLQDANAGVASLAAILFTYLVIAALVIAVYFSAALVISYSRALAFSLCAGVIDFIAAAVIVLVMMMPSLLWTPISS